ncbi:MAG TPA: Calx-beta domain-containing protein, partial [Acidimicrobiia bacterium]|nr:Calx-beta domain-containing protein [Acidimicrobiia bacterium]
MSGLCGGVKRLLLGVAVVGATLPWAPAWAQTQTLPRVTVGDSSVVEGDTGTVDAVFPVTLSEVAAQPVSVHYATAAGPDAGGAASPADFTAATGTVTIEPGRRATTVAVRVAGDRIDEGDETFTLTLSEPVNATIGGGTGIGTIVDDDRAPALSIADAAAVEGDKGPKAMTFTVTLDHPSGRPVSFTATTADGTGPGGASAPGDYEALSATPVEVPAGAASVDVAVPIEGDLVHEGPETFTVSLAGEAGASVARRTATGTITDNDPGPDLSVADAEVPEGTMTGKSLTFTLALSVPAGQAVTAEYATADGTAVAAPDDPDHGDYTPASGHVTFAVGDREKTVTVLVNHDGLAEGDETLRFTVTGLTEGIGLARGEATGTITNDDGPPDELAVSDLTVPEGDRGARGHLFTVTRTRRTFGILAPVTVRFSTADGTATGGSDYTPRSGVLVFAGKAAVETIPVSVDGDTVDEDDETFTVTLSDPTNAVVTKAV